MYYCYRHLYFHRAGHNAVQCTLGEGVKATVLSPHEVRLEQVTTTPVILKQPQVELHGQVWTSHIDLYIIAMYTFIFK